LDGQAPPGLREQVLATIAAVKRLLRAHIDLAKAEIGEILDAVKRVIGLALGAVALLFAAALLLFIGGMVFLGEWLFGSSGWGVLLGSLLLIDLAVTFGLLAADVPGRRIGRDVGIAAIVGLVVGVVLALNLLHDAWSTFGDNLAPSIDPAWRPTIVAVVTLAIVGFVAGFLLSARGGRLSVPAALGLAALGAVIGLITAATIATQVGAALGVLVGLIVWPALSGIGVARRGIDTEGLKAKFTPDETINETKETIEWVRARVPLVPKS
jgi:tetrahydromethanopterin S-methyltransferase subunit G